MAREYREALERAAGSSELTSGWTLNASWKIWRLRRTGNLRRIPRRQRGHLLHPRTVVSR